MSTLYSTLQRLWRDNQADIDQHGTGPNRSDRIAGHCDGLSAANARILAAMAGAPRNDQPTMSRDQIDAWIRQHRDNQTTHVAPAGPDESPTYAAGQVPTTAVIEGEILPPEPRVPDAPAA